MNKYKMIGFLFVILGVLVIVGASYVVISYASDLLTAIVDFVTTTDFQKLQGCGISPPAEFHKLKGELATMVLPALYLGIPIVLIILSGLMFLAGFYYHRGRHQDDTQKTEELEREMLRKAVKKIEVEKVVAPPEPEEVYMEEEEPAPKKTKKK